MTRTTRAAVGALNDAICPARPVTTPIVPMVSVKGCCATTAVRTLTTACTFSSLSFFEHAATANTAMLILSE